MPTSEPALVELNGAANACDDDAATAVRDNAAADNPIDDDSAVDVAAADRPTASYEGVACSLNSVVNAALSEASDGKLVLMVESGFTVIEQLDCTHRKSQESVQNLLVPRTDRPWQKLRIIQAISEVIFQSIENCGPCQTASSFNLRSQSVRLEGMCGEKIVAS